MNYVYASIFAVAAAVLPLRSADAGVVVVHFRELAAAAAARGIEPVALPASSGQESTGGGEGTATQSAAGTSVAGAPGGSTPRPPPHLPLPLPLPPGGTFDPAAGSSSGNGDGGTGTTNGTISARTNYLADQSYADFDDQGCGGATAARGPAGLLPLAVAALALLRRRR